MEEPSTAPVGETENQKQARLRRERRNAKIQAGGSARLSKITALNGSTPAPEQSTSSTSAPSVPSPQSTQSSPAANRTPASHADDPEEVDISKIFARQADSGAAQDPREMFRQMLMSPEYNGTGQPGAQLPQGADGPGQDDPIMRMMEQMMSGGGPGGAGGLPPGLASMFGDAGGVQQQPELDNTADRLWRVVHAVCALLLAWYSVSGSNFAGSKLARAGLTGGPAAPQLFWMFTTVQLVLQSTRYFLDRGQLPASGILTTIGSFLPEPYANYVRMVSRYSIIYTTIVSDAMLIVFVLGCVAWWKGNAA